jgi:hypothetical protein
MAAADEETMAMSWRIRLADRGIWATTTMAGTTTEVHHRGCIAENSIRAAQIRRQKRAGHSTSMREPMPINRSG